MIILSILEILCIIPLTKLWLQADKNKINEDTAITIGVSYGIIASVINWFFYGAYIHGLNFSVTSGFYGGDWNTLGILISICIPLISLVISYIIFLIIAYIKYS